MSIEKISSIWPEWSVVEQIGEGSFGKVYKTVRNEYGITHYAAVKVISIPKSVAELNALRSDGYDETSSRTYLESIVDDFVNEIKLMILMQATDNIISVEDYKVVEKTDSIGWDIFIRMELLTSLIDYSLNRKLEEAEVIKLGIDICSALELCAQKNIIHRDIKPENIFVSTHGNFKLGDFGVAKELEKSSGSMSMTSVGTSYYVAPEVKHGKIYDATVDMYSLGIVLYKLINNSRLPFMDAHSDQILYHERIEAVDRRLSGEPLPYPVGVSEKLADVVMKACMFDSTLRFRTATEFKQALEVARDTAYGTADYDANDSFNSTGHFIKSDDIISGQRPQIDNPIDNPNNQAPQQVLKSPDISPNIESNGLRLNKNAIIITSIIGICVIVITVILTVFSNRNAPDYPSGTTPEPTELITPTATPTSPPPTLLPTLPPPTPIQTEVQSISVERNGAPITDISLIVGDEIFLDALILPTDVEVIIEWTSSNQDVFIVYAEQNGHYASIIGMQPGSATLSVKADNVSISFMIYVNGFMLHQPLGDAILTTNHGIRLVITWDRGDTTIFEREKDSSKWMITGRAGGSWEVDPNFSYENGIFSIGFPTITERYFLYIDGTGYRANRDGSSSESLTWDFYVFT